MHEEAGVVSDTSDRGKQRRAERSEERAVYIISVAAELAGVHPQTLRMYERRGLLAPKRTSGNTRRYSERDIARIQMIQELTQREGISLAGVKLFIEMREQLAQMRQRTEELERELVDQMQRRRSGVEIVPLRSVRTFLWGEGAAR
jgi:MerR family transcriptional regulator, heat shock protein HspR